MSSKILCSFQILIILNIVNRSKRVAECHPFYGDTMKRVALLLIFLFMASTAFAEQLSGKVVGISDGDTLTLLTESKQQVKIRLSEIDTPESNQPYGSRARQALSDLAFGQQVRVSVIDQDRYGRTVGRVYVGETDINAELVRQGAAWVYRQYAHDKALFALEEDARQAQRGLWALPEAQRVPPWEWRRTGQQQLPSSQTHDAVSQQPKSSTGFSCGSKRYCREMSSCAEARFYLEQCGLSRLDGDHDGVPCESLCR